MEQVDEKKNVYVLMYIHTDIPDYSETLGVFNNKSDAVESLLEYANYRKNINNQLTQYMKITHEYPSYEYLYNQVYDNMYLKDDDIYKISELLIV